MKKTILLILLFKLSILFCITLEVSLDGSKPYTTIQSAINASQDGDIVLVYPGTYQENIDYTGKNISLASLFLTTNQESYIANTIIDGGNAGSCIKIRNNVYNASLIGLTLINGSGSILYGSGRTLGGGIAITEDCTLNLSDCVITNCTASEGAGIYVYMNTTINMSNTSIFNNYAYSNGGGIFMYYAKINFHNIERNSVYNNYSNGSDIVIMNSDEQSDIYLDTLSVNMSAPDQFFVILGNDLSNPVPDIHIYNNHSYLNIINHDLYVAPDGNDQNSGLSSDQPLRSIAYAMHIIESDSLNPKSIYLAPGTYYRDNQFQRFPFYMKSYTSLIGSETGDSILDNLDYPSFLAIYKKKMLILKISLSPIVLLNLAEV